MTRVLLIEDNPGDVLLARRALSADGLPPSQIDVATSGPEALARMRQSVPDVVLLDLNLPGMDGRQILAAMRGDPNLVDVPVIVLTSSASPDDVRWCYRNGANAYVRKVGDFHAYEAALARVSWFWFHTAELIRRDEA